MSCTLHADIAGALTNTKTIKRGKCVANFIKIGLVCIVFLPVLADTMDVPLFPRRSLTRRRSVTELSTSGARINAVDNGRRGLSQGVAQSSL